MRAISAILTPAASRRSSSPPDLGELHVSFARSSKAGAPRRRPKPTNCIASARRNAPAPWPRSPAPGPDPGRLECRQGDGAAVSGRYGRDPQGTAKRLAKRRSRPAHYYDGCVSSQRVSGGVVHRLPADLRGALIANAAALSAWEDITPLARNEFICWVEDAKQEKTRRRRIRRTREELEEGRRRPCCWPGCSHRERTGR